jgi:hypothetical protein
MAVAYMCAGRPTMHLCSIHVDRAPGIVAAVPQMLSFYLHVRVGMQPCRVRYHGVGRVDALQLRDTKHSWVLGCTHVCSLLS